MDASSILLQQNIIHLLGLSSLPLPRQQELLEKIANLVQKRIIIRIIDEMSEENKAQGEKMLSSGTDEEKAEFLQGISNLETVMKEEILKIKQELLDEVGSLAV